MPQVAHVELPRRPQHHASIESGWEELRLVFESLSRDPEIRVIVLSGMGGEDLHEFGKDRKGERLKHSMQECITTILACAKPVICVTLGSCWTQSMGLITACDIRISASSASFAIKRTGLAGSLSLRLLPKVVGNSSWIFDVAFSGREFDASEALRVGFVSRVVDGEDKALREGLKLAEIIAARSPSFVQKSKQALWRIRNIRARIQSAQKWSHGYSEAEMAADLDQALGVGTQKRTRGYSEAEMAADLNQALGVGNVRRMATCEKL